jgi:hypothetical protein
LRNPVSVLYCLSSTYGASTGHATFGMNWDCPHPIGWPMTVLVLSTDVSACDDDACDALAIAAPANPATASTAPTVASF